MNKEKLVGVRRRIVVNDVTLRSLNELERINLRGLWGKRVSNLDPKDEVAKTTHYYDQCAELLTLTIEGENQERMFADTEVEQVKQLDGWLFDKLSEAAWDFCFHGNDRKEVDALEKKSDDPADTK